MHRGQHQKGNAMETETPTQLADGHVEAHPGHPKHSVVILRDRRDGHIVMLDRAELQALVQLAYDRHGILAQPWVPAEPEPGTIAAALVRVARQQGLR